VFEIRLLLTLFIEANNTLSNFLRNWVILFKFIILQPNYYPDKNILYYLTQYNNQ
jgi:hypothetical protein